METIIEISEENHWPAWYYGPDNQSAIFTAPDEVPEGWEDHPSKVKNRSSKGKQKEEEEDPYKDLTIEEARRMLVDRNVEFNDRWPLHKLVSLLRQSDGR